MNKSDKRIEFIDLAKGVCIILIILGHTGIAVDERPMRSFRNSDFLPFKAGIDAGADAVLVSHNIVTAMDKMQLTDKEDAG